MNTRRQFTLHGGLAIVGLASMAPKGSASSQRPASVTDGGILQVGPQRRIKTIREASKLALRGTTVEVDAGDYVGDVATWALDDVHLRAIGGRVRLRANGASEGRKAIWVVRARGMVVEGFDFEDAVVPDQNGAGIRLDRGSLRVRDCRFLHNQMGLLTSNDSDAELVIENSEFAYNQRPDGHNHNLYVGRIARLSVTGSYFHHARTGHLLKSRAALNLIQYNRLTDESGGTASYELEFPDGGIAVVLGNIIGQSEETENRHLLSFGAESYFWQRNALYLSHNTLINPLAWTGIFLRVGPGAAPSVAAVNNLLVGEGSLESSGPGQYRNNLHAQTSDFADLQAFDCALRRHSPLAGRAVDAGSVAGNDLRPRQEYLHPRRTRPLAGVAHNPGAIQLMTQHASPR
jgi:hypothetical protein